MKLMKKLEDIFSAVAFAEAGEFDTAREMVKDKGGDGKADIRTREVLKDKKTAKGSPSPARP